MSVSKAIVTWEELKTARDAGVDPVLEEKKAREAVVAKANPDDVLTVAQIAEAYLDGYIETSRGKKGAAEARRAFDTLLGDMGSVKAKDVTRAQAFNLISTHAVRAPVLAARLRSDLGGAWDYAYDAGILSDSVPNWWRLILRKKLKSKGKAVGGKTMAAGERNLSLDEVGQLLRWLPNFSPLVADVLTVYLWTCTRGAEIFAVEGKEVERVEGILWWTVPKAKTKNRRLKKATDLRVPLFGRAKEVITRRIALFGKGYLFPGEDGTGHADQNTVRSQVNYYQPYCTLRPHLKRERLPVTYWSPHDLRRTSRTFLAALGCPNEVAEAILGHVPPGVVGTYNKYAYDNERMTWLMRLSEHLEGLA